MNAHIFIKMIIKRYTWSPTFFRIDKALSPVFAGLTLTVFWSAVSVGRIIISTILCKIKPYIMVIGISLLSLLSLFFMIFFSKGFLVFIAIGFVGLGYSGIFSLIFSIGSLITLALIILLLVINMINYKKFIRNQNVC